MDVITENPVSSLVISSRKRRIAAFLIDHVVMSFLIVCLVFSMADFDKLDPTKMIAPMLIGFFIYFSKDSIKGISFGSWIMSIMVRDENDFNKIPSFGRLFLRNLFIAIWPVEFIVLAVSSNKKRIGDIIARTAVVKNPNKPKALPRILSLVGIGIIFLVFFFVFIGGVMKNSDAYKAATNEIEHNPKIQAETGGIIKYGYMPTGSINITNEHGEAHLNITVIGKDKTVNVAVSLEKEPCTAWKVTGIEE